jgi:hypothetical protein
MYYIHEQIINLKTIRNHLSILSLLLVVANSISAQSTFDKWPAIKEFHDVMSEIFIRPRRNLAPIKARSEEMMIKPLLCCRNNTLRI